MDKIKVFNEVKGFRAPRLSVERVFKSFLKLIRPDIGKDGVSVVFVDENEMKRLNETWKNGTGPTDVLSFDYGDIHICPSFAKKNASELGHTLNYEILFLVAHGLLHVSGWTHETDKKMAKMMNKTNEILANL